MENSSRKSQKAPKAPPVHWADHVAEGLIRKNPDQSRFVCASGISPSGRVHIGNFREVITVDFVVRALRDRGKEVRFMYVWDNYDALRKIPKNIPNGEKLEPHLRKPISKVPDPFGEETSYAAHFEKLFEKEILQLGIQPDFVYQKDRYESGVYADGIKQAKQQEKAIMAILNQYRSQPLPADWSAVSIFCSKCSKDLTKITNYEAPSTFHYHCKDCKVDQVLDVDKQPGAKLLWRVDWPMRWAKEGVDFEPGGKDHSSQGGSYETGSQIIREVWKKEPPRYLQYDFVLAKGIGSKISSSSGNTLSLSEAMEIYEPPIVRWLFASRKPNMDFSIAFDLDVLRTYDDFDRTERIALGTETVEEKKLRYEKRIYEMSVVSNELYEQYLANPPSQFPFRHLSNLLQIFQGDADKTKTHFTQLIQSEVDETRYLLRAKCCWNWITKYAPEAFRFSLRTANDPSHKAAYPQAMNQVIALLQSKTWEQEKELANAVYAIIKENGIEPKAFFQDVYQALIGKPSGPKLASFLLAIGPTKASQILQYTI